MVYYYDHISANFLKSLKELGIVSSSNANKLNNSNKKNPLLISIIKSHPCFYSNIVISTKLHLGAQKYEICENLETMKQKSITEHRQDWLL